MDPAEQVECGVEVPAEVPLVDRFVVRGTVPDEVQLLHTGTDLSLPCQDILRSVREGTMQSRCPERGEVPGLDQVAPEAERQLGDDATMDFRPSSVPRCACSGFDQVEMSLLIELHGVAAARMFRS